MKAVLADKTIYENIRTLSFLMGKINLIFLKILIAYKRQQE